MTTKTQYVTARGYAEYAKVFPENRDMADKTSHPGVKKMLKQHDGQYSINFYPADETELNKCFGPLAHELYGGGERLKEGQAFGVGKFINLKRKHTDIKDTKKGPMEFGGAPEVVWWTEADKGQVWDWETDGPIGNGSEIIIKFSVYGEGTTQSVRLEKVGVINHIPYEAGNNGDRF
jgi:hypothetical protein